MKYQNIKNQKEDKQILGYSIASALSGIMDTRGMKLYQKPSSTPPKISKIELKLFEEALRIAAKK
ncbi:MAG TPA: hypothetical protein VJB35_04355 [Candidatus Nanoarchaeia archaeon]|nr:hypothetical protein [Candidatus Nanoarchaeia archaeon]